MCVSCVCVCFKVRMELGRVSNFNQWINLYDHMNDHDKSSHLTKFDAFRVNRHQVIDIKTSFKIHTNASDFETASPKTI